MPRDLSALSPGKAPRACAQPDSGRDGRQPRQLAEECTHTWAASAYSWGCTTSSSLSAQRSQRPRRSQVSSRRTLFGEVASVEPPSELLGSLTCPLVRCRVDGRRCCLGQPALPAGSLGRTGSNRSGLRPRPTRRSGRTLGRLPASAAGSRPAGRCRRNDRRSQQDRLTTLADRWTCFDRVRFLP